MKKTRILFAFFLAFAFLGAVGAFVFRAEAQTAGETDAIAIRVIPNPEHFSPMQWYKKQGFAGNPEMTTVDGYPAVRDGRTVYVNVANTDRECSCSNTVTTCTCTKASPTCIGYFYEIVPASAFPSGLTAACFDSTLKNKVVNTSQMDYYFNTANADVFHCADGATSNIDIDWFCSDVSECSWQVPYCNGCRGNMKIAYSGTINITEPGDYIFASVSNDESDFVIDGTIHTCYQELAGGGATPPAHSLNTCRTGHVPMSAGNHTISYRASNYQEGAGAAHFYWIRPSQLAAQEGTSCIGIGRQIAGAPVPWPCDGSEDTRTCVDTTVPVSCSGPYDNITCGGLELYTNIYLISYTQEGTPETMSIFDQILKHWRFNTNENTAGYCEEQPNTEEACLVDSDCSGGGFCNSQKAKLTRDTERLGNVVYLREAIDKYRYEKGGYPKLGSGTYLPGKTISTWPSWTQEFGRELGISAPSDPVNKMGNCGAAAYDSGTCWDDENKTFSDPIPANGKIDLPAGSNALVYEVSPDGLSYNMCAYMESGLAAQLGGAFGSCTESVRGNTAPEIDCGTLLGFTGGSFTGYVSASDPDGDPIDISFMGLDAGFDAVVEPSAKRLKISHANPAVGDVFTVSATDINGDSSSKTCSIVIQSDEFSTYPIEDINVLVGKEFGFTAYVNHSKKAYDGIDFIFDGTDPDLFCNSRSLLFDGRYKCEVKGFFSDIGVRNVSVHARNGAGELSSTQEFDLNVYNDPPIIITPLTCDTQVRVGSPYRDCQIKASDPNGHSLVSWSLTGAPAGITITNSGLIRGTPTATGDFSMVISVLDQYGGRSVNASYTLNVNDYCGDGVKERPNMEGTGGRANDGYEDCDGTDGTPNTFQSSISWQYGCETNCRGKLDGYCGDNVLQSAYDEECDDGNAIDGDGCNTKNSGCWFTCGDGVLTTNRTAPTAESCDFGGNNNCCNTCSWTTGPTSVIPTAIDFSLDSGASYNVPLPDCLSMPGSMAGHAYCRGITGASFDVTFPSGTPPGPNTGMAIVFVIDLSGSQFDPTYVATKQAMLQIVDRFYNRANSEDANMHVGTFVLHGTTTVQTVAPENPANNFKEIPLGNLLDSNGGAAQRAMLLASINTYGRIDDQPDFAYAYSHAHDMLSAYGDAAVGEKYVIILTDGYSPSGNGAAEAAAAKADDVQIYTVAFSHWPTTDWTTCGGAYPCNTLRSLCNVSSDNNNTAVCYTGSTYARRKPSASVVPAVVSAELDVLFNDIMDQIVSRIPKFYIDGTPYDISGVYDDIPLSLPAIGCDITGATPCSPATFNFSTVFAGVGQMRFNDFKFNVITPCED